MPDFALPDHTATVRRLSELQGDDPMVLVLIRGFFCPKDRAQLHELVRMHEQLVVGSTRLVTITTDDWHTTNNLRQQLAAHWPFLYDEARVVRDRLDIEEYTDPEHRPMIPHTFVLAPGLVIRRIYNGYYYWGRPSSAQLHADLAAVTRHIRADWDLQAPGLREQWEAGRRDLFYPFGTKSMEQTMWEMAGAVDRYAPDRHLTGEADAQSNRAQDLAG